MARLDAISCPNSHCTSSSAGKIARRSSSPNTNALAVAIGLPLQPLNTAVPLLFSNCAGVSWSAVKAFG
jgi:hypothetical protein